MTDANLKLLRKLEPIVEERTRTGTDLNRLLLLKIEIGRLQDKLATLQQERPQIAAHASALLALPVDSPLPAPRWVPRREPIPTTRPGPPSSVGGDRSESSRIANARPPDRQCRRPAGARPT
ncbi:MAG: hypothetical protein J6386_01110 [Candidatus Synoicihabitans palmerolidicus]|nr:hypothetical protein [Candidatus Synoicihabitans palmerolidicus]